MKWFICLFKSHTRGRTKYIGSGWWRIKCKRCGFKLEYKSPRCRLIGTELKFGFDGK